MDLIYICVVKYIVFRYDFFVRSQALIHILLMDKIEEPLAFLAGVALLMETVIVMILLSRVLKYKVNRLANISAAIIHILV